MTDVFVLTSGDYSSENIDGVFASRDALIASLCRYRLQVGEWWSEKQSIDAVAFVALLDVADEDAAYFTWKARARGQHVYRAVNSGIEHRGVKHGDEFDAHDTITIYVHELHDTAADNILCEGLT